MKVERAQLADPLPVGEVLMLWIAQVRMYLGTHRRSAPQQSTKLTGSARLVTATPPGKMVIDHLNDPGMIRLSHHPVPCAATSMK